MSLTDLIPGGAQARGALIAGAALLTFGAGFGAAEAYEHWVPWGAAAKLSRLRDSLPARDAERYSAGAAAQKKQDEDVVERQWRPALALCQSQRDEASRSAAQSLSAERTATQRSSDAAYRLGRASCGGSSEKSSPTPVAGSVGSVHGTEEDLRSIVAAGIGATP